MKRMIDANRILFILDMEIADCGSREKYQAYKHFEDIVRSSPTEAEKDDVEGIIKYFDEIGGNFNADKSKT